MATTFPLVRRNSAPARATRLFVVREVAVMAFLFVCYRQVRYLTRNHTSAATTNAHRVVEFERSLGAFTEGWVQDLALHSHAVITVLNRYYVTVHFPLTALFVVWALIRHRSAFRQIRTWLYTVTAAALAIHVAFPLAPPRMLAEHHFVDTLQVYGPRIYSSDTTQSIANQYAAMPSLHFGWAIIVAAGFVAIKRTRRSLLALAHPVITLLAIVATANHYWVDAAVALGLIVLAAIIIRPIADFLSGRPMPGHRVPAPSERRPDVSRCLDVSIASVSPATLDSILRPDTGPESPNAASSPHRTRIDAIANEDHVDVSSAVSN
jgi:PAP2 superfamily